MLVAVLRKAVQKDCILGCLYIVALSHLYSSILHNFRLPNKSWSFVLRLKIHLPLTLIEERKQCPSLASNTNTGGPKQHVCDYTQSNSSFLSTHKWLAEVPACHHQSNLNQRKELDALYRHICEDRPPTARMFRVGDFLLWFFFFPLVILSNSFQVAFYGFWELWMSFVCTQQKPWWFTCWFKNPPLRHVLVIRQHEQTPLIPGVAGWSARSNSKRWSFKPSLAAHLQNQKYSDDTPTNASMGGLFKLLCKLSMQFSRKRRMKGMLKSYFVYIMYIELL